MKTQNRERLENYHLFWLVIDEGECKKNGPKKIGSFEKWDLKPAKTK